MKARQQKERNKRKRKWPVSFPVSSEGQTSHSNDELTITPVWFRDVAISRPPLLIRVGFDRFQDLPTSSSTEWTEFWLGFDSLLWPLNQSGLIRQGWMDIHAVETPSNNWQQKNNRRHQTSEPERPIWHGLKWEKSLGLTRMLNQEVKRTCIYYSYSHFRKSKPMTQFISDWLKVELFANTGKSSW